MENIFKHSSAQFETSNVKGFLSSGILNKKNGTLKFIKVEPNSHYPLHLHVEKIEYAVIIEGTPDIAIDEVTYNTQIGDVIVFPARVKHAISNNTSKNCILLIASITVDEN